MSVIILGIESSCDDTSAAVCENGKIISNVVASQRIHEMWGGVVPELASRAHQQNMVPVVDVALKQSGKTLSEVNAIAFTKGPGLIGSLLVGSAFAKGLSLVLQQPMIEVNHMEAHVWAHFIDAKPEFPFLCLTVSGGHTQLVLAEGFAAMRVLGETIDDAAGEAFDKSAKMLGLPYPGGPQMDKLAETGNPHAFAFSLSKVPDFDFSFSGVKTSVLYFLQAQQKQNPDFVAENIHDLCASIQHTIVEMLMKKLDEAVKQTNVSSIALAGGVSANSYLRKRFLDYAAQKSLKAYIPAFEYCTDNAAMIAMAGYFKFLQGKFATLDSEPQARWAIGL